MNLDNSRMELAYVILVLIAWTWAFSQWRMVFVKGGSWRLSTAIWMTAKAAFFSVAASVWWFNWTTGGPWLERAIYALVIAHVVVFIQWLNLDRRAEGFMTENGESRAHREDRQNDREDAQNERETFQNNREQRMA